MEGRLGREVRASSLGTQYTPGPLWLASGHTFEEGFCGPLCPARMHFPAMGHVALILVGH